MKIELRPYQSELNDIIHSKIFDEAVRKLCVVLPTGGGKSVLIAKLAEDLPGRTLILTHRIEILQQNSDWLKDCSVLTAKENTMSYDKNVIAMVQTAFARIKKYGTEYLGEFDNIILDEVQVLIFEKVFEKYDFKKLIGFTATPVTNKKVYSEIDGVEFVEPYTLDKIFDDIVQGVDTQDLIDIGQLVQDFNIILNLPSFDKLKDSKVNPDGYTTDSLNEVYANMASLKIMREAYFEHCKGKKTLIFNATTRVNKLVYDDLLKLGLNVRMFDTVNEKDINPETDKKYTRKEIIEWFRNERDAILVNTNVFTTGFDVDDVECVIVNRATKSLSLWIQMVGRGSRPTKKIFKDTFKVIDLGQNIYEHGIWSNKRDWTQYFKSPGPRRKNKSDMLRTWECKKCGAYNLAGDLNCTVCGTERVIEKREKSGKDGKLQIISEVRIPTSKKIIDYCRETGQGSNFAFKLLENKIMELFIYHKVSKDFYEQRQKDFAMRVMEIYRPIYFAIIRSDLPGGRKRLLTQVNRLLKKINKMYD